MIYKRFLLIFTFLVAGNAFAVQLPQGFTQTTYVSGLSQPTACAFASDGRLFILQKQGKVRIFKNGKLLTTTALSLSVNTASERGLLGIAFDPSFSSNKYIYLYYTTSSSSPKNRVSRFVVSGDTISQSSEKILLDGIRSDVGNHNAGMIQFGRDGKLYIATGDGGQTSSLSQDLNSINGKILRINSDGSIPSDNPFAGKSGKRGEIYAYGLRNPWRFAFDFARGTLLVADVGNSSFEEVNLVKAGKNYGWPSAEGTSSNSSFVNPIYSYSHNGSSASITGGVVYRGSSFPSQYQGVYFFGDFVMRYIKYLKLSSTGTVQSVTTFSPDAGSSVHFAVGTDGALYFVDFSGGKIFRIQYQ
jgi:glucose/arabinose dehydrogenase